MNEKKRHRGLMLVAFQVDTAEGDPALPLRALLSVARGIPEGHQPQVVGKGFMEEKRLARSDELSANDVDHLAALGFDTDRLGVSVVFSTEQEGRCLMCDGVGKRVREGSFTALEVCPRCKGTGKDPEPGSYISGGIIRSPRAEGRQEGSE